MSEAVTDEPLQKRLRLDGEGATSNGSERPANISDNDAAAHEKAATSSSAITAPEQFSLPEDGSLFSADTMQHLNSLTQGKSDGLNAERLAMVEQELMREAQRNSNGNNAVTPSSAHLSTEDIHENFGEDAFDDADASHHQVDDAWPSPNASNGSHHDFHDTNFGNLDDDGHLGDSAQLQLQNEDFLNHEFMEPIQPGSLMHDVLLRTLPALDSFALQILQLLGRGTHEDTLIVVTQPETSSGQAYEVLCNIFNQIRQMYSPEPFLDAEQLNLNSREIVGPILRANLATFLTAIFGSTEVGFYHMNENFLNVFCPRGSRLLKSHASLFLDLKTQAYISAISSNDRDKMDILAELFPDSLEKQLKRRRNSKKLSAVEEDLVRRVYGRREHLINSGNLDELVDRFPWQSFLKNLSEHVARNHEMIVLQGCSSSVDHKQHGDEKTDDENENSERNEQTNDGQNPLELLTQPKQENIPPETKKTTSNKSKFEFRRLLARTNQDETPTAVLYEEAKRRNMIAARGSRFIRRPWSREEEQALLEGLDRVKGPFWAEILKLYGPGGTINEVLKDRNQVQLKDKARNLKLYFLKNQLEVPINLRYCTGEVRNLVGHSR